MEADNIFEQENQRKIYIKLALPLVVSMVISVVYNVADTYFVAQTQNTLLVAGISLCAPVFTILMAFGNIYAQGGSSIIGRLYGAGKTEECKHVSSFCFYIALLTGLIIGIIMLLLRKPLLTALGADASTWEYALPYYITMACGAPFVVANFIHSNLLRSEGMSRESMIGNVGGLLLNIVLDPIFISVLGMGAFGAALASVIGYIASVTYFFTIVCRKSKILSIDPKRFFIPRTYTGQIFAIGISAAITNWMSSLCMIITNHYLLLYGADQVAAMGIAQKVSMIALLVATGMVFGASPMIGYYYGGHNHNRLKKTLKIVLGMTEIVTILLSIIVIVLARPITSMFLHDSVVISAATLMLRFQLVSMCLAAFIMLATICFQASGFALEALIASILRQGIVFLAVIIISAHFFGYMGVICAQLFADAATFFIVLILFLKRYYCKIGEY